MTVLEVLKSPDFNNASISLAVFGSSRAISDKNTGHRSKKWLPGDYELIAKYFKKKYKINLELT